MRFYIILISVTVLDQVSKILIRSHMQVGDSVSIWNHVLNFIYYQNSGAAGGIFEGYGRVFVVPAVALVVMVGYLRSQGKLKGLLLEMGTGFLIGGAIGNAIDRVLFNKVTDFINFAHGHGILNIADLAINLGVILILADTLFGLFRNTAINPKT
jgi:signal peptidase II